jgi:hypothetical protein
LPAIDLKLEHESTLLEAGKPRQVKAEIKAVAFGAIAERLARQAMGSRLAVHGLSRDTGQRQASGPACPVIPARLIFREVHMATFKKFNKDKRPKRNTQSLLFKRKRFCRFTVAGVEEIDYKDIDTCATSSAKTARSSPRA